MKRFSYGIVDMVLSKRHKDELAFSSSARRDLRTWAMFVVGAVFVFGAYSSDPQKNCGSNIDCASWLLPVFFVMGAVVGVCGLGMLMANPNRGTRFDPDTGELVWWQNRYGKSGGDEGRIAPEEISLIRIDRRPESKHEVHLYDRKGVRQFYFDEEVIGWDPERLATAMRERWPQIAVEVID